MQPYVEEVEECGGLRGDLPLPRSRSSNPIDCHSFLLTENVDTLSKHRSFSIQRTPCCALGLAG